MRVEERIAQELRAAAEAMPERNHEFPPVLHAAKKDVRIRRVMAVGIAASVALLGIWGAGLLVAEPAGRTLPPAVGTQRVFTDEQAEAATESFVEAILNEDRSTSWELLTLRAKQRVGGQEKWAQVSAELRAELSWIEQDSHRLWVTNIPARAPETYIATYTAPPKEDSGFLESFTLEESGDELGIDLKRRMGISLQPEAPVFRACAVEAQPGSTESSGCSPEELWPPVTPGDTFSVLLERLDETFTTTVDHVWFAVGDGQWVGEARLVEGAKSVRALVTFEPENLTPGENVFTVTIETSDGSLETYGYRVMYEG